MADYDEDEQRTRGPSIVTVDKSVAVLTERLTSLKGQFENVERKLDAALALFATKEDLRAAREALEEKIKDAGIRTGKIENWLSWAVKIVVGLVITAVVGTVIYTGKH